MKRYEIRSYGLHSEWEAVISEDGDWADYADVEKLIAENASLKRCADELRDDLIVMVERALKSEAKFVRCERAEALIASLKRCGTCRLWDVGYENCTVTKEETDRADTCDKWEIDND